MDKEIQDLLEKFTNYNSSNDDSYLWDIDNLDFSDELDRVMKEIGITQYTLTSIGGFDSPGYDISCYCLAYIDMNNKLQTIPINFECF